MKKNIKDRQKLQTNKSKKNLLNAISCKIIGPLPLKLKNTDNEIPHIFVDGGIKHIHKFSKVNNKISVGDGDSTKKNLDILLPKEKDYSDLNFALSLITEKIKYIFLDGFLPNKEEKRFDHFFAIIGECYEHCHKKNSMIFISEDIIIIPKGTTTLNYVGKFGISAVEKSKIKIKGNVKYPLKTVKEIRPLSSFGISNEAMGEFQITSNHPLLITISKE